MFFEILGVNEMTEHISSFLDLLPCLFFHEEARNKDESISLVYDLLKLCRMARL
jgi:hypothetical protein